MYVILLIRSLKSVVSSPLSWCLVSSQWTGSWMFSSLMLYPSTAATHTPFICPFSLVSSPGLFWSVFLTLIFFFSGVLVLFLILSSLCPLFTRRLQSFSEVWISLIAFWSKDPSALLAWFSSAEAEEHGQAVCFLNMLSFGQKLLPWWAAIGLSLK